MGLQKETVAWDARPGDQLESGTVSITSFFRPLIVALLLSECGLQAQPLVETYKRQEELRLSVAEICQSQFEKAQYHPVEGQEEDLRWMISAKGVQAIKAVVIPSRLGGSYKCDRERYEQPMLLGRTYRSSTQPSIVSPKWTARCRTLLGSGIVAPSECASVRKERLELEPCFIRLSDSQARLARLKGQPVKANTIETTCLVSYIQFDDELVDRLILSFRS